MEFNIVSNFYFFIFGMCIRKEACLFVSLHFCPKNEILISLLRVYCLVEHLVKEMVDLNDACVLDIVYFVEGKCSFLTILFVVSYKTNANNNLRNPLEKCVDYFQLNLIIQTARTVLMNNLMECLSLREAWSVASW